MAGQGQIPYEGGWRRRLGDDWQMVRNGYQTDIAGRP